MLATRARRPTLVAIDGRSGGGKTHLAATVAAALRAAGASVYVLSMDEIYPGWDGLAQAVRTVATDILEPLTAGGVATYQRWDWAADAPGAVVDVPDTDVVIVEGVGSTAHSRRDEFALTVWVHAPAALRLDRACGRDGQGDYAPYAAQWAAQEDCLFGPDTYPLVPRGFDMVVDTFAPIEATG